MAKHGSERSSVLFWPRPSPCRAFATERCLVVGWDDDERRGRDGSSRTTVCAFLVPLRGDHDLAREASLLRAASRASDDDAPTVVAAWRPKRDVDAVHAVVDALPALRPTSAGPCWEDASDDVHHQTVFYDPAQNHCLACSNAGRLRGRLRRASAAADLRERYWRLSRSSGERDVDAPASTVVDANRRETDDDDDDRVANESCEETVDRGTDWAIRAREALRRLAFCSLTVVSWDRRRRSFSDPDQTDAGPLRGLADLLAPLPLRVFLRVARARGRPSEFERASTWNAARDAALGLLLGHALLRSRGKWSSFGLDLDERVGWLETFPAGFKLNVPLTERVGAGIRTATEWRARAARVVVQTTRAESEADLWIDALSFACSWYGASVGSALLFDVLRASTLHVRLVRSVLRLSWRAELATLSSLWLLFRGKKKNVLRRRTDTLRDYDYVQLLLGIVLFTVALFLFTTVLVYHAFFATLSAAVDAASASARAASVLLREPPPAARTRGPTVGHVRLVPTRACSDDDPFFDHDATPRRDARADRLTIAEKGRLSILVDALGPPTTACSRRAGSFVSEILTGERPSAIDARGDVGRST